MNEQLAVRACLAQLTPMRVIGATKIRIGGPQDGGYVMIDDTPADPVCYSIGVGPDVSWDIDMSSNRNAQVFQYDHTVESPPATHPQCYFHKIGLGANDYAPDLRRLDTLVNDNGHAGRNDLILKCDIEGAEWEAMTDLAPGFFERFDQIVMELHWVDHLHDAAFRSLWQSVVGNMYNSHQCYHVHGNNYSQFSTVCGISVPSVIEVSLARRRNRSFGVSDETYPGPLDLRNRMDIDDLYLGQFRY